LKGVKSNKLRAELYGNESSQWRIEIEEPEKDKDKERGNIYLSSDSSAMVG
jgi:hypothetical protein